MAGSLLLEKAIGIGPTDGRARGTCNRSSGGRTAFPIGLGEQPYLNAASCDGTREVGTTSGTKNQLSEKVVPIGGARIARAFGRPPAFLWRTRPLFGPQSALSGVLAFSFFSELALTLFPRLCTYPAPSERFFENLVAKTRNPKELTREQPCDSGRNASAANAPLEKKTVIRPTPHGRCRHWDSSAGA